MSKPLSLAERAAVPGREQLSGPFTGRRVSQPLLGDVTSTFPSASLLQSLPLCCHGLLPVLVDFYPVVPLLCAISPISPGVSKPGPPGM